MRCLIAGGKAWKDDGESIELCFLRFCQRACLTGPGHVIDVTLLILFRSTFKVWSNVFNLIREGVATGPLCPCFGSPQIEIAPLCGTDTESAIGE